MVNPSAAANGQRCSVMLVRSDTAAVIGRVFLSESLRSGNATLSRAALPPSSGTTTPAFRAASVSSEIFDGLSRDRPGRSTAPRASRGWLGSRGARPAPRSPRRARPPADGRRPPPPPCPRRPLWSQRGRWPERASTVSATSRNAGAAEVEAQPASASTRSHVVERMGHL